MANDLSTPSVGLQVQEQRAQTQQAPMVDVSGVAYGQPDWKALGEAGRKFSNTVNDLFQETSAKYELLKYQQELGDIQRRYINSHGNGSPDEMKQLQAETDKAWNRFKIATGRLNSDKANTVIGEANEYGRRYRDSILNQQAKFVEDFTQKNNLAELTAVSEDAIFAVNDYKSENFKQAWDKVQNVLARNLTYNGFNKGDPLYDRTVAETNSKIVLSAIKYNVANKDFSNGWDIYTHFKNAGILIGDDLISALSALQILKDEQAAKAAASSTSKDNIAYAIGRGNPTPEQVEIFLMQQFPIRADAIRREEDLREENYNNNLAAYNDAIARGGTIGADGSVTVIGEKSIPKPVKPKRLSDQEIMNIVRFEAWELIQENRKKSDIQGQIQGIVYSGISAYASQKGEAGKSARANLRLSSPEDLVLLSGYTQDPIMAKQIVQDWKQNMSGAEFSEFIDTLRYLSPRDEAAWAQDKINADNMTLEQWNKIVKRANDTNQKPAEVISTDYHIPLLPAQDVANKLRKFYSDKKNSYASTTEREIIDNLIKVNAKEFAKWGGADDTEAAITAFTKMNWDAMTTLGVQALRDVIETDEVLQTYIKVDKETGDKDISKPLAMVRTMGVYQGKVNTRFSELAKEYFEKLDASNVPLGAAPREKVSMYGNTFSVMTYPVTYVAGANTYSTIGNGLLSVLGDAQDTVEAGQAPSATQQYEQAMYTSKAVLDFGGKVVEAVKDGYTHSAVQRYDHVVNAGKIASRVKEGIVNIGLAIKDQFNEIKAATAQSNKRMPANSKIARLDEALARINEDISQFTRLIDTSGFTYANYSKGVEQGAQISQMLVDDYNSFSQQVYPTERLQREADRDALVTNLAGRTANNILNHEMLTDRKRASSLKDITNRLTKDVATFIRWASAETKEAAKEGWKEYKPILKKHMTPNLDNGAVVPSTLADFDTAFARVSDDMKLLSDAAKSVIDDLSVAYTPELISNSEQNMRTGEMVQEGARRVLMSDAVVAIRENVSQFVDAVNDIYRQQLLADGQSPERTMLAFDAALAGVNYSLDGLTNVLAGNVQDELEMQRLTQNFYRDVGNALPNVLANNVQNELEKQRLIQSFNRDMGNALVNAQINSRISAYTNNPYRDIFDMSLDVYNRIDNYTKLLRNYDRAQHEYEMLMQAQDELHSLLSRIMTDEQTQFVKRAYELGNANGTTD